MIVISDTSSISNLYQIDRLYLLKLFYGEIFITPAVYQELNVLSEQKTALEKQAWVQQKVVRNQEKAQELLEQGLDVGEAESIALALEEEADLLLMDEYKGREIATRVGLKVIGVLGILIKAKKEGYLAQVREDFDKLHKIGFRLNRKLIADILHKLGE